MPTFAQFSADEGLRMAEAVQVASLTVIRQPTSDQPIAELAEPFARGRGGHSSRRPRPGARRRDAPLLVVGPVMAADIHCLVTAALIALTVVVALVASVSHGNA